MRIGLLIAASCRDRSAIARRARCPRRVRAPRKPSPSVPPALSPPTASRPRSTPYSAACACSQRQGVEGIVDGGGKFVLRREPVIHRQHRALAVAREHPAQRVVRIDAAHREAAAVVVHQRRRRFGPTRLDRLIKAHTYRRIVARRNRADRRARTSARSRSPESARFFRTRRARAARTVREASGVWPARSCRAPARSSDSAAWCV